jgi:hypothetical protein
MWQYILGLVSGVAAASFGSWLTNWFEQKNDKARDKNIFEAFKEEIITNLEMLSANSVELEKEVAVVAEDQHLLTTLTPYYFSTWDILKTHIPPELSGKEIFRQLALTMHLSLLINAEMESRERFKVSGAALTNFSQTLGKRDQLLLMRNIKLLTQILELNKQLGIEIAFSSPATSLREVLGSTSTEVEV